MIFFPADPPGRLAVAVALAIAGAPAIDLADLVWVGVALICAATLVGWRPLLEMFNR